jgi:preprotein translocase subunit YajC
MITLSGLEGTDFSIQGSSSVTIKAKKSYSLKILCMPTSGGLKTAKLEIHSNDPDTPTLEISLAATLPATTPDISVAQTTLDFGSIRVGKKVTKTLKITNNGSGDLVITLSGLEGTDFSIQGSSSVTIKAKKSCSLKVLCTPTSGGLKTATLEIHSNDPDTPTLNISLTATLPATTPDISVAQTTLDFGSVKSGKKVTKTLKITNNGTGDLVITLSGLEGTDFTIQGSSSVTIKGKKSYSLKVLFTPKSAGLKTATLKIDSNDPDTPTIDIPLTGIGL